MYTDKTVAQAMSAINERLHTSRRPQLDGWVEKSGRFAIGVTTPVRGRFKRHTFIQGKAERESGMTIIEGTVPSGVSRTGWLVIFIALLLVGLVTLSQGNAILGIIAILAGVTLYVPLTGDYNNCEILLSELQKALNAKFTPPKKETAKRPAGTK
jgi:hypothetical protein